MTRTLTKPQAVAIAVVILLVAGLLRGALPAGDAWRALDVLIFVASIFVIISIWRRTEPRDQERHD